MLPGRWSSHSQGKAHEALFLEELMHFLTEADFSADAGRLIYFISISLPNLAQ